MHKRCLYTPVIKSEPTTPVELDVDEPRKKKRRTQSDSGEVEDAVTAPAAAAAAPAERAATEADSDTSLAERMHVYGRVACVWACMCRGVWQFGVCLGLLNDALYLHTIRTSCMRLTRYIGFGFRVWGWLRV